MAKDSAKRTKKDLFIRRVYELFGKHRQILVATLDNVGSLQIQQIRKEISKHNGLLLVGKNTIIRKAVQLRCQEIPEGEEYRWYRENGKQIKELEGFLPLLKNKVGFIFTDEAISDVKTRVEANKIAAPARVGTFAQSDVSVPPGPTGMDPSQISFFHALQISTKIQKGQIEITKDFQVCIKGKKIGSSEVSLLQKMNIKPFFYNMNIISAYDSGSILGPEVISLSTNDILDKFRSGVKNLTALSMQTGIPTELSIPHSIVSAFKNLAAIGLQVDYKFKQIADAGKAPVKKQEAPKVEKKVEKPVVKEEPVAEPEEDVDMGSMFD